MPAPGPGACLVCRGPTGNGEGVCFACRVVSGRLGLPLVPVVPARLCPIPSALYRVLLGYKESVVAEERRQLGAVVRALCRQFLADADAQLRAVAGGAIEVVVVVPSTARTGPPPLARLVGLDGDVRRAMPGAAWAATALERARRSDPAHRMGHMVPDAGGFAVGAGQNHPPVRGRRVLLLDDLYVSGSRAQSAAAALRRGGARSVVVAPIGRVLRPDRVPAHRAFLERQRRAARDAGDPRGDPVSCPRPGSPSRRRAGPPAPPQRRTVRG